ncbi:protein DCL chloroplastic isoform X2 [Prunus yedoensis var. nudiflora]|uniref:Protein DCL chloroplastic isoform X2 n=1 Tax=Prunus yedoensis var. nudiflora TaxID=2094558 RepID=A0A314Z5Y8_PRUYE|nr:protein DCL chloroplastic isoform X2 [Prunus yedoensis var. nudiflora]
MILHSGKYESGDRLSPEHEKTVLERLLPFHPEAQKKIGSGIDYITVGYHPILKAQDVCSLFKRMEHWSTFHTGSA